MQTDAIGSKGSSGDAVELSGRHLWLVWIASFAIWTLITLASSVTLYQFNRLGGMAESFLSTLALEASQALTYAPLTPVVFFLAMRYPLRRDNWGRRSLLYLGGGLLFTTAHVILRGITYEVWDWRTHAWISMIWDSHAHRLGIRWDLLETLFFLNVVDDFAEAFIPIVLIAHAVLYYRRLSEKELRTSQLEAKLATAHLHALKSQLQPHFLFNTLHSISSLMLTDVRAADRMMTRLSDLLRMSLESKGEQVTPLNLELQFVTSYLEIERIRFEDRLRIVMDVAPDTLDALVPHLLLQPLVENAVRHGISRLSAGGCLRISVKQDGPCLLLRVQDNGPGMTQTSNSASGGLGLSTTRDRLRTLYGDEQKLEFLPVAEGGVEVRVRIPFRMASTGN
jgi:two-component system LytT family sensor kinase